MTAVYPVLKLKKKKENTILGGHPWVFSRALETDLEKAPPGSLVRLHSHDGKPLGTGIYNPLTSIRIRLLSRVEETIDADFFVRRFRELGEAKMPLLPPETTAFRLAHGDADDMPGLIIDFYENVAVFQIHTAGMDPFRDVIIEALKQTFDVKAVVERSDINARKREGLKDGPVGVRFGEVSGPVEFKENGLRFTADVLEGQKTGFFLDQRDTRQRVRELARGRRVLNLFGYTGAFSVYAAAGGAASVVTLDDSREAVKAAERHMELNGFKGDYSFVKEDAFDYCARLRREGKEKFDLIVCDPPAFAKTRDKLSAAVQAYVRINTACLRLLSGGGVLVASSCSGVVSWEDFRNCLRSAGTHAQRDLKVMGTVGQPMDHTDKLSFSEGRYLKTLILRS